MQDEEDVSFIDLLVVVIKHRRLIIGSTVLSTLVAGIIFFGLPIFGFISFSSYTIKASVVPEQIPPALAAELGVEPYTLITSYAQEIMAVSEAAIRNGITQAFAGDTEGWQLRTFVARSFIGKKYMVHREGSSIILEVCAKSATAGKAFLSDMISYAESRARNDIVERSTVIAESMENLYKDASESAILSDTAKQIIIASRKYIEDKVPSLVVSNQPEVLIDAQGRGKNAVITVLATFFVSIFLSFVLEYVEQVKSDPNSSQKIRKAFNR